MSSVRLWTLTISLLTDILRFSIQCFSTYCPWFIAVRHPIHQWAFRGCCAINIFLGFQWSCSIDKSTEYTRFGAKLCRHTLLDYQYRWLHSWGPWPNCEKRIIRIGSWGKLNIQLTSIQREKTQNVRKTLV